MMELLAAGANPLSSFNGDMPLHIASKLGHSQVSSLQPAQLRNRVHLLSSDRRAPLPPRNIAWFECKRRGLTIAISISISISITTAPIRITVVIFQTMLSLVN